MPATVTRETRHSIYDDSYATDILGNVFVRPKAIQLIASRTGAVLPKHRDRIKNHQEATTAMTAYTQSCKVLQRASLNFDTMPSFGSRTNLKDTAFGLFDGNPSAWALPLSLLSSMPTAVADQAKAEAIAAATQKVKSINSPFNTQVFAAELHEVKGLLTGPLAKYAQLLLGLNRNLKRPKISTKDISNLHLELQFGVIPLIADFKSIMGLLSDKSEDVNTEVVKAFGESSRVVTDQNYPDHYTYVGRRFDTRVKQTYTAQYFIRAGIAAEYQERAHGISALSDQLLDLLQVPVTLWEATPYSFLVDYFVNIGDIVDSTTRADSLVSWTSQSLVQTIEQELYSAYRGFDPVYIKRCQVEGSSFKSVTSKLRKVTRQGGSLGIPPLTVTLPGRNMRYANIAALLFNKS